MGDPNASRRGHVGVLLADFPLADEAAGDVFNGLILERLDENDGELDSELLLELGAILFELIARGGVQRVGEIVPVPLRFEF